MSVRFVTKHFQQIATLITISGDIQMKWLCGGCNTCFQITVTGLDITGDTHVKKSFPKK